MPASPKQKNIRLTVTGLIVLVGLVIALVVIRQAWWVPGSQDVPPPPNLEDLNTFIYKTSQPVASFELTDKTGAPVTNADLNGHWTLAFVSYTHSPDVREGMLKLLQQVNKQIPDDLPQPRYLFISADPGRDTPERLRDFLRFFGDDMDGFTGDRKTLEKLVRSLNGTSSQTTDENGRVQINHSDHLSLLDPEGKLIAVIQPPHQPQAVVQAFTAIYQWAREKLQILKAR